MAKGIEGLTVSAWVDSALTLDAGIQALLGGSYSAARARVWEGIAPAGTPYPFVTFTVVEPRQINGVGVDAEIMSRVGLQVKAVTEGRSYTPIIALAARIHVVLGGKLNVPVTFGASTGLMLTSERRASIQYPENASGAEYRHLGHLYELNVQ